MFMCDVCDGRREVIVLAMFLCDVCDRRRELIVLAMSVIGEES